MSENDPVMQDEIFGPILPIITINSTLEGIKFVNKRQKPLALYVFSNNKSEVDLIINNTNSGEYLQFILQVFLNIGVDFRGSLRKRHYNAFNC